MTANYRNAWLPDHCGTCYWHDWDEYTAVCTHHCMVSDDDIAEAILDDPEDTASRGFYRVADGILDNRDSDRAGVYDHYYYVCDSHEPKLQMYPSREEIASRRAAMLTDYHKRVDRIVSELCAAGKLRGSIENLGD